MKDETPTDQMESVQKSLPSEIRTSQVSQSSSKKQLKFLSTKNL